MLSIVIFYASECEAEDQGARLHTQRPEYVILGLLYPLLLVNNYLEL